MSLARSIASRSFRQFRTAKSTFRAQRPARRGYASAGPKAKASDLPWLITSIAVTVPGTFLLLNSANLSNPFVYPLPGSKHHGHHDDEEHEEGEEEATESGEEASEGEEKSEGDDSESKEEGKSEDGDKEEGSADSDEASSEGEEREVETGDDNRKIIKPDAKGGYKRRVESGNSEKLGMEEEGSDADEAAPSKKEVGDSNTQSGKQAGLSNTDTKHSTNPAENPDQSTKGEGVPETAKMQGTVDPSRPQK